MLYNYAALLFFAVFALAVPTGLILASKILGRKDRGNPIKNAPYESAEATTGSALDVENEYLPFFALFLPFEIVVAMILVWATVALSLPYELDLGMITLGMLATIAAMAGYRIVVS